jgi:hypothetical protein
MSFPIRACPAAVPRRGRLTLQTPDAAIASGTAEFKPGRFEDEGTALRCRAWLQEVDEAVGGVGATLALLDWVLKTGGGR